MNEDDLRRGHCLCGGVTFQTRGPLRDIVACHCTQCRRQSGHFYAATSVADECLTVQEGGTLSWYQSSDNAERGFCARCGSALFWRLAGEGRTSVLAGAFDGPTGLKLGRHIFCADKGDYYEIDDGLPHFEAG